MYFEDIWSIDLIILFLFFSPKNCQIRLYFWPKSLKLGTLLTTCALGTARMIRAASLYNVLCMYLHIYIIYNSECRHNDFQDMSEYKGNVR